MSDFLKGQQTLPQHFDPATGYPADSGLRGVTVIDPCSTKADALTTALFVMGLDKGMKFCEENEIAAVFITSDKQVYTTSKTGNCTFEFLGERDAECLGLW